MSYEREADSCLGELSHALPAAIDTLDSRPTQGGQRAIHRNYSEQF